MEYHVEVSCEGSLLWIVSDTGIGERSFENQDVIDGEYIGEDMERFINFLERKMRRVAISGLMRVIVFGMALSYIISFMMPGVVRVLGQDTTVLGLLVLDRDALFAGQIWRLVSYIFLPPNSSPIFIIISLFFYYSIGMQLERQWGAARFNIFYLFGMIGTTIAAMFTGFGTNTFLNYSLFFAFAILFPNLEILLLFIPVKVKYLAYINAAFFLYYFVIGTWTIRAAILASLINVFLFFGPDYIRGIRIRMQTRKTRQQFKKQMRR